MTKIIAVPFLLFEQFLYELGVFTELVLQTFKWVPRRPVRLKLIMQQIEEVGMNSLPVVLITSGFTGAVLALQSYTAFKRFGAESLIGTVVALAMTRELAPVLTGLIVAGRAGSAMAAELGTMRVTEQVDALYTLATNPIQYLIVPRFIAGIITLPMLTAIADFLGIFGGYFVGVFVLNLNGQLYLNNSFAFLEFNDVMSGLFKSVFFGAFISLIGCYKGFYTQGGAEGVGKATTGSVVASSMAILISDYFLTALLFE